MHSVKATYIRFYGEHIGQISALDWALAKGKAATRCVTAVRRVL